MVTTKLFAENLLVLSFGSLGALLAFQVGVFNLAVEAAMLNSTFTFFAVLRSSGDLKCSVGVAIAAAVVTATAFALLSVVLRFDEIVCGIAVNMFSLGLTTFLCQRLAGERSLTVSDFREKLDEPKSIAIAAIALVAAIGLFRYIIVASHLGPKMIAARDRPLAGRLCDINVIGVRIAAIAVGGVFSGCAGIALAMLAGEYSDSAWKEGIGFICLALVASSRGATSAAFLGGATFVGVRLICQGRMLNMGRIPSQVLQLVPYLMVIVIVCGMSMWRRRES